LTTIGHGPLVSEAIAKYQEELNKGSKIRKLKAWLRAVAGNLFIDHERQWKKRREIPIEIQEYSKNQILLDKSSFDSFLQHKQDRLHQDKIDALYTLLQNAIETKLDDEDRKPLAMAQAGMTDAEIAGAFKLDLTDKNCIKYISYRLDLLHRKLRYHCCGKNRCEKIG
jgi:DNA-directed RNA polymerase specialized sigma24 family protein